MFGIRTYGDNKCQAAMWDARLWCLGRLVVGHRRDRLGCMAKEVAVEGGKPILVYVVRGHSRASRG